MEGKILTEDELREVQLSIINQFDEFCKINQIQYFLAFGTLLGAIRHNGFIPWDDDVDIVLTRPEYEKLAQFTQISDNIKIVTHNYTHGYWHPFTHMNLADTHTIMKETFVKKQTGKGVFVDIFVIDGLPDNKIKQKIHCKKLLYIRGLLRYSVASLLPANSIRNIIKNAMFLICRIFNPDKLINKIDSLSKKYNFKESNYVSILNALPKNYESFIYEKKWFSKAVHHTFEEKSYFIPKDYNEVLTRTYKDYMTPPPVSEQVNHHGVIYEWK